MNFFDSLITGLAITLATCLVADCAEIVVETESPQVAQLIRVHCDDLLKTSWQVKTVREIRPGFYGNVNIDSEPRKLPTGSGIVFAADAPGIYEVTVFGLAAENQPVLASISVDVQGARPPPGPEPKPEPKPAGPRRVIVLYETAETTPAWADYLTGLRKSADEDGGWWKQRGHQLRAIDDDTPGYESYAALTDVRPCVVICRILPDGKFEDVHVGALPATEGALRKLIEEHGG